MADNIANPYSSEGTAIYTSRNSFNQLAVFGSTVSVVGALTTGAVTSGAITSSGVVAGTQLSASSVDFASVTTGANSSSMTRGELRLVFAASGISLVYSSGASVYIVGQSAVSGAQG
jgi:hypothetical protein